MRRAHALYAKPSQTDPGSLIRAHAGLIQRLIRRVALRTGRPELLDDLWSCAAMALLDAHARFDPAQGTRFETFAEHRIRGALLDELRRLDPYPRRLRDRMDEVETEREKLRRQLGRPPDEAEVASALGATIEEVASLEQLRAPPLPELEALALPDESAGADERMERAQLASQIAAVIGHLPERLQLLLSLHYVEDLTYKEVAQVMKVTEARVCQLHKEALGRIRQLHAEGRAAPVTKPLAASAAASP